MYIAGLTSVRTAAVAEIFSGIATAYWTRSVRLYNEIYIWRMKLKHILIKLRSKEILYEPHLKPFIDALRMKFVRTWQNT